MKKQILRRSRIISEYWIDNNIGYAYITTEWKTILEIRGKSLNVKLYNINKDPQEKYDLKFEYPDIVANHIKKLIKHIILEGHVAYS